MMIQNINQQLFDTQDDLAGQTNPEEERKKKEWLSPR
jgi:hypothetical protein